MLAWASDARTATEGDPSERATPAIVRACSEPLNTSTAEEILFSMLVGTART